MELKNALAVCLISLFSATLVVLIARALDVQAASRLEPHLAGILEELQAIRKQGGLAARAGGSSVVTPSPAADTASRPSAGSAASKSEDSRSAVSGAVPNGDVLMVYYFHGSQRCATCRSIELQARQVVESNFAEALREGTLAWKSVNYDHAQYAALARHFQVSCPVVVLARTSGGQVTRWQRLDDVLPLSGDGDAFAAYVRGEVEKLLSPTPR